MPKIVAVIRKRPELSRAEFLHAWQAEHPDYVRRLPGLRSYRQFPAIEHRTAWFADGMAELEFDSLAAIKHAYETDAAKALAAHEEHFLASVEWFIADELQVPLSAREE